MPIITYRDALNQALRDEMHARMRDLSEAATRLERAGAERNGVSEELMRTVLERKRGDMEKGLKYLLRAEARVETGDYDQRVETDSRDEVGRLAAAFNRMAGELGSLEALRREAADAETIRPVHGVRSRTVIPPRPFTFCRKAARTDGPPRLGEHTDAVLRELLKLPPERIAALRREGAIARLRRREPEEASPAESGATSAPAPLAPLPADPAAVTLGRLVLPLGDLRALAPGSVVVLDAGIGPGSARLRLGPALFRQINVGPSREKVLEIPIALPVANQGQCSCFSGHAKSSAVIAFAR